MRDIMMPNTKPTAKPIDATATILLLIVRFFASYIGYFGNADLRFVLHARAAKQQLRNLAAAKTSLHVIVKQLHRQEGAVAVKCRRLDIEVVVETKNFAATTTSIIALSEDLPSVEVA
jgi:hypothetical protein